MRHIYEHDSGVLLGVDYYTEQDAITFTSVQVLDKDYKAIGPNLMFLFDNLLTLKQNLEGVYFLSEIVEEIKNGSNPTIGG